MFYNGYKHVFLEFQTYVASVSIISDVWCKCLSKYCKSRLMPEYPSARCSVFLFHWREPRALSHRFRLKMHEKIKPKHKIGSLLNPSLPLLLDLFPMQTKRHLNLPQLKKTKDKTTFWCSIFFARLPSAVMRCHTRHPLGNFFRADKWAPMLRRAPHCPCDPASRRSYVRPLVTKTVFRSLQTSKNFIRFPITSNL
jgi:hypothetical protein